MAKDVTTVLEFDYNSSILDRANILEDIAYLHKRGYRKFYIQNLDEFLNWFESLICNIKPYVNLDMCIDYSDGEERMLLRHSSGKYVFKRNERLGVKPSKDLVEKPVDKKNVKYAVVK